MTTDRSWEAYISRTDLEDKNGNVSEQDVIAKLAKIEERMDAIETGTASASEQTPTISFDGQLPF